MHLYPARSFSLASLLALVSGETFTGYVVDNYCWDRPGHRGIDGSQLGTNPGSHILHCFWQVSACRNGGYLMLESLSSPTSEGYTYGPGPQLDATGDNLVYELAKQEQTRGGDRPFNEQFTITGMLANGEIAVDQVCLTPSVNNANGETFCLPQTTATATTTTTVPPPSVVNLDMTVSGIDYAALSADSTKKASFITAIKAGIVQEFNSRVQGQQIMESDVETTLRAASARRLQASALPPSLRRLQMSTGVVAESQITLPSGADSTSAASTLTSAASSLGNTVTAKIQAVPSIASVMLSGATIAVSGVAATDMDRTTTVVTTTMEEAPPLAAASLRCETPAVLMLLLAVAALF